MLNPRAARDPRLALASLVVLFLGCSSDESTAMTRAGSTPAVASDKQPGMPGAAGQSAAAGTSSAMMSTTTLLPPPMAAAASNTAPVAQATPNTNISREPLAIDHCSIGNAAGLIQADVDKLKAAGASGTLMKWLYPYDGTVFPRGMRAPDLMWDGPAADAVYLHIKSMIFEYWGCLVPSEPGRLTLDQGVWDAAGQRSFGKDDVYTIELSALSRGTVVGTSVSNMQIAQAAIKGSIYYNTYRSNLNKPGMSGGADPTGGFPHKPQVGWQQGGGSDHRGARRR